MFVVMFTMKLLFYVVSRLHVQTSQLTYYHDKHWMRM